MWLFITSILSAHTLSQNKWNHNISLGYQYRTLVPEESFLSSHCSVLQYSGVFTLSGTGGVHAFVEPSMGIVGLNQSILQPSVSMILGFQLGNSFTIGSGPTVSTRDDQENTFFPQILIEGSLLLHVDGSTIPIKFGYVPMSYGLTQYQLTIGYTWN
ncbi:MAG: hypothetical protein CL916_14555 [Deltaproteobacteria bacterium]|nr:hypothetical protein [Deltaproteobacteria bacterium]